MVKCLFCVFRCRCLQNMFIRFQEGYRNSTSYKPRWQFFVFIFLQLLKWQGTKFALESSSFATSGASSLVTFSISSLTYAVVANSYDSSVNTYTVSSSVYLWSATNRRFSVSQTIQTQGAVDVDFIKIGLESYLFFTNSKSSSRLYRYKSTAPSGFTEVQQIAIAQAKTGKFFSWNNTGINNSIYDFFDALLVNF